MTLPTGVSTFLLECLDVDSTADYNAGTSDSLNSCPSPETFRDDGSGETSGFFWALFDVENVGGLSIIERLVASLGVTHQVRSLL